MGVFLVLFLITAIVAVVFYHQNLSALSKRFGYSLNTENKVVAFFLKLIQLFSKIKSGQLKDISSFQELIQYLKFHFSGSSIQNNQELDMEKLNCRIHTALQKEGNDIFDALAVEICGSIHSSEDGCNAAVKISVIDITDGLKQEKPVRGKVKSSMCEQGSGKQDFCFSSDLGKLPNKVTVLSEWTNIARLRLDWMVFPRRGNRVCQFNIFIFSKENNKEIAYAECIYEHENPYFGYIDIQENIERSKTLAVALAFAVSTSNGQIHDSEVEYIKNWARENINTAQTTDKIRQKLEKALDETVAFFKEGNHLNIYDICIEIAEIVPVSERYNILDMCLHVAIANGKVSSDKLNVLREIAKLMEVNPEKFRQMCEKIIPVDMLDTKEALQGAAFEETILGVTSDMNAENARAHLNKEYAKWNSRVTNSDPKIQSQADQMLKIIAQARSQYTKK